MNSRNMLTRRSVLMGTAAVASASLLARSGEADVNPGESVCPDVPSPGQAAAQPQRAISLRELSAELAAGRPATLQKLTRLDGYITDAATHDIILWGQSEPDQPDLHIEDFVIALRAVHGRYGEVRDGTNYIKNPLISIDPDPAVFRQINQQDLLSASGQQRFAELCKSPQTVRVEGMPRNTRVAKVLVDADYRMKMVGQGTVTLPISSPFPSHHALQVQKWREEVDAGRKMGPHINTRFWFQAGRFSYQASEQADTVFLDRTQVVLNDENQMLSGNALIASGKTDPLSRAFVCSWTGRMEDTYKAEAIWRDMYNIFRHFAVARVMKDRDAITQADFNADFLLEQYVVPTVNLPPTLEGLGHIEKYQEHVAGGSTHSLAFSVCGGVSVGFMNPLEDGPATPETLSCGPTIVASRPAVTPVSWTVAPGLTPGPS